MTLLTSRPPQSLALAPATTLRGAWYALDPLPLDFAQQPNLARSRYVPHAAHIDTETQMSVLSPSKALTKALLKSTREMKSFLSGHVGSGKSTELRKIATSEEIVAEFFPITLEIEAGYWEALDISQLLFLMACAIYDYGNNAKLLNHRELWKEQFEAMLDVFLGPLGLQPREGTVGVEFNLVFVKLKTELKLGEQQREKFRELSKTRFSILTDLLGGLVADLQTSAQTKGDRREPVLFIDDLDKVRSEKPQQDTFRTNPSAFFEPPLRVVYTVPTGVAFNDCPQLFRDKILHLYPAPTLKKARNLYNPENVANDAGINFMEQVLKTRIGPSIFDPEAIRLAAIYSGGVLRNFFRLLRTAIDVAEDNDRDTVDKMVMGVAIKSARLNESMSLHEDQYKTLAKVHETNFLAHGNARYLDQSWVFECFNDKVWYEANPLLWKLLDPEHK